MAVQHVATAGAFSLSPASSVNITAPPQVADGDFAVVVVSSDSSAVFEMSGTGLTHPRAGWAAGNCYNNILVGTVRSISMTVTTPPGGQTSFTAVAHWFRGVDAAAVTLGTVTPRTASGNDALAVGMPGGGSKAALFGDRSIAANAGEASTALTLTWGTVLGTYQGNPTISATSGIAGHWLVGWSQDDPSPDNTAVMADSSGNAWGMQIALPDAVAEEPWDGAVWNGTAEVRSRVTVWDGAQEVPAHYEFAATGNYRSVAHMLQQPRFFWAHRGGSTDYLEHSMYAYDHSVALGYGALEISMSRTVDGVWFGLHDDTLQRTSGVNIDASTLTWAQVSAYQSSLPGKEGSPAPYVRLDELVAKYGSSKILLVDPKTEYAFYDELLQETLPSLYASPQERVVVKAFGNGRGLADKATALGYEMWGFYYESSYAANMQFMDAYTILGMEHNASQAAWDALLALGKPVVAHVCETRAQAEAGFAKGARGVQVGAVVAVAPMITEAWG
jgi:glycerophosphoryl diester phosphodiesterase